MTISSPFLPFSFFHLHLRPLPPLPAFIALRLIRLSDITFILVVLFSFTQNAFFSHLPRGKLLSEKNGLVTRRDQSD